MIDRTQLDKDMSLALKKHGAFFAFSNKQFEEQREENIEYCSGAGGMLVPTMNYKELNLDFDRAYKLHKKRVLATHSRKQIINHELGNYECQISMDIDDAVNAVSFYGITREEVAEEFRPFMRNCVENDLF